MKATLACGLLAIAMGVRVVDTMTLSATEVDCASWMPANHYCDWQCNSTEFNLDSGDCSDPPLICPAKWIGDGICQPLCDTVSMLRDGGDCKPGPDGCIARMLGNGYCDPQCNDAFHNFDSGDCVPPPPPTCNPALVGNRYCDEICNDAAHKFDDGDCVPGACEPKMLGNGVCDSVCDNSYWFFDNGDCDVHPKCEVWMPDNGYCDWQCNNPENAYDKGDCPKPLPTACLDWMLGNEYCDDVCNNAKFNFDDGDCDGVNCLAEWVGDGTCQQECNNELNGWDAGDCNVDKKTCYEFMLGNGYCDWQCNSAKYEWDGHDCCPPPPDKCLDEMAGNGYCDEQCNTEKYAWDAGECSYPPPTCLVKNIGNGICNRECYSEKWVWDGGDCDIDHLSCLPWMRGNGYCDPQCNIAEYNYDHPDCTPPIHDTCVPTMLGNAYCDWQCNFAEFNYDDGECLIPPTLCLAKMLSDDHCDAVCDTIEWLHDNGDCPQGCSAWMLGNTYCDWQCNTPEYNFDNGACSPLPVPCKAWMLSNGYCDLVCNSTDFGWDGGDCEEQPTDCQAIWIGDGVCDRLCNIEAWDWDAGDCEIVDPCLPFMIGNGYCDFQCNTTAFNFDNGDCGGRADACVKSMIGNGVCDAVCNTKFNQWDGGDCVQRVWYSDNNTISTYKGQQQPSVPILTNSAWTSLPGVSWIWVSSNADVGTLTFTETFTIPSYFQSKVVKVTLQMLVDNFADISLNSKQIGSHVGGFKTISTYDLTSSVKYDTSNTLVFVATNSEGPGGLAFQITVDTVVAEYCYPSMIGDGVCNTICNTQLYNWDGEDCVQQVWYSDNNTISTYKGQQQPSVLIPTHPAWTSLPGVSWVWVSSNADVGTFTFTETFTIPAYFQSKVVTVTLQMLVDNFADISLNSKQIGSHVGGFKTISTYDLTSSVKYDTSNSLQFVATNSEGPGGLAFQITVNTVATDYCYSSMIGDGVCNTICNTQVYNWDGGDCVQRVWYSDNNTISSYKGQQQPSVLIPTDPAWASLPGVSWIWVSSNADVGTFTFTETFTIPSYFQSKVVKVTLQMLVDNFADISLNSKQIASHAGGYTTVSTYDLTSSVKYDTPNSLQFVATNSEGPGGLAFQIIVDTVVTEHCYSSMIGDGICNTICNTQVYNWDGGDCVQRLWYSDNNTISTYKGQQQPSVLIPTHPAWASLPRVSWIWVSSNADVGTFTFTETFTIPAYFQSKVVTVTLQMLVDNFADISLNSKQIGSHVGGFATISTYDLTSSVKYDTPNTLQFVATNSGGPGGLAFQITVNTVVTDYCFASIIGDGVCNTICNTQAYNWDGGDCVQRVWYSDNNTISTYKGQQQPSVLIPTHPAWTSLPGVSWVWVSSNADVGTFTFTETFTIPAYFQSKVVTVTLQMLVDNFADISLNSKQIGSHVGGFKTISTYDLTSSVKYDTSNTLQFVATNSGGPGGLAFQITVNTVATDYCYSSMIGDGVCNTICNTQAYNWDGGDCVQRVWYSDNNTISSYKGQQQPSVLIPTHPAWASLSGVSWIWVSSNADVGTFTFTETFTIPAYFQSKVVTVTLQMLVDNFADISLNSKQIGSHVGGFKTISTYDLTSSVKYDTPNTLQFVATNSGGPGGLAFQITVNTVVTDYCYSSMIGDGICNTICTTQSYNWDGGDCVQRVWNSDGNTTNNFTGKQQPSVLINTYSSWSSLPGVSWIWVSSKSDVGTWNFTETFTIPSYFQGKVANVTLKMVVDDFTDIILNSNKIASHAGNWHTILSYDLTSSVKYDTPNSLVFIVSNTGGPGGLTFQITLKTS